MNLTEALAVFLRVDRAPSTNESYRKVLSRFSAEIGPRRAITLVTPADLDDYVQRLRCQKERYAGHPRRPGEQGGLSPATIEKRVKAVRAFFSFLHRRGYLPVNPAADVHIRKYQRPPGSTKAIRPEELLLLIQACRESPRDFALVLFLADTGCRAGGAASLRLENLQLEQGRALLQEKGGGWQHSFFGPLTRRALRNWLEYRPLVHHRFVWTSRRGGVPLRSTAISEVVRRRALQAGIDHPVGPHAIRHRVGQAWADAGLNPELVRLKLGHSDVSITLSHYFNQDLSRLEAASQQFALAALAGLELETF